MVDADVSTSAEAAGQLLEALVSAAEHASLAVFPEVLNRYGLRLLMHAIVDRRRDALSDDATILVIEWWPTGP
ncbi:hypothetical protein [Streptomyces hygroscopicus]|uniref:hypothetical protein n=1 Tax=Streptomyces hygroscopicus TaxID=1912 RepID=UPI003691F261